MKSAICEVKGNRKKNELFLFLGLIIRILIVYLSDYFDTYYDVKYTDVDYIVFTDASRFVSSGESPYKRLTYRYTPLLSYLLVGNIRIHKSFGKYLFCMADIVLSRLALSLSGSIRSVSLFILFNPIMINVCTRGNADQIVVLLVVLGVFFFKRDQLFLSGVFYGLAIHFKIYPVVYSLMFFLHVIWKFRPRGVLYVVGKLWVFCGTVIGVNIFLGAVFYWAYGYEFLYETYLYHLVRSDNRHNFSIYFYMIYLTSLTKNSLHALLMFLPQAAMLLLLTVKYFKRVQFACVVLTIAFVAFNKVMTVQYFVWYIPLFALLLDQNHRKRSWKIGIGAMWFVVQAAWLAFAYRLEFRGENTFLSVWLCSVAFFCIHIALIFNLCASHKNVAERNEMKELTLNNGVEKKDE